MGRKVFDQTTNTDTRFIEKNRFLLYLTWLIALVGTVGSLYFSQVLHLIPCLLCWFQRILLYPLVILIPVGIIRRDDNLPYYVLSLSLVGIILAGDHLLLFTGVIPEAIIPCQTGISCSTRQFVFGYLPIPLLSLLAFSIMSSVMFLIINRGNKHV